MCIGILDLRYYSAKVWLRGLCRSSACAVTSSDGGKSGRQYTFGFGQDWLGVMFSPGWAMVGYVLALATSPVKYGEGSMYS